MKKLAYCLILILILISFPVSQACNFYLKYYYDRNKNGKLDAGDRDITSIVNSLRVGNKVILPTNSIVRAHGKCNVRVYTWHCSNTAGQYRVERRKHAITVFSSKNLRFVHKRIVTYDTSKLSKEAVAEAIRKATYIVTPEDIVSIHLVNKGYVCGSTEGNVPCIYGYYYTDQYGRRVLLGFNSNEETFLNVITNPSVLSQYVGDFSKPEESTETLENTIMKGVLENVCKEFNCEYSLPSSALGVVRFGENTYYIFWERVFSWLYNRNYIDIVVRSEWVVEGEGGGGGVLARNVGEYYIKKAGVYRIQSTYVIE